MKRIGIITIHNSPNYGACLQSFALYEYIRLQKYDVEIIDLHRPFHSDYIPSRKYKPFEHRFDPRIHKIKRLTKSILKWVLSIFKQTNEVSASNTPPHSELSLFDDFNKRITQSSPYLCIDELYANPPHYDIYITGSDQVWNPTQAYCIEPYFLTFVKEGKKISYGASIGIVKLTDNEKRKFKRWLSQYDSIAVREPSAQKLLEKITRREINRVADPTFLLGKEYWSNFTQKPVDYDYILVFTLAYEPLIIDYALNLAKESGKKLIVIGTNQPKSERYAVVNDATPEQWLGYIADATLVLTDSFHCTVFSIILQPNNFYTYIAPWNDRGSRIVDLLSRFSLTEHLLPVDLKATYTILAGSPIDYDKVNEVIKSEQALSRAYLKDNI